MLRVSTHRSSSTSCSKYSVGSCSVVYRQFLLSLDKVKMSASGQPRQVVLETTMASCSCGGGVGLGDSLTSWLPGPHPLMKKNSLVYQVKFLG